MRLLIARAVDANSLADYGFFLTLSAFSHKISPHEFHGNTVFQTWVDPGRKYSFRLLIRFDYPHNGVFA